MIIIITIKVHTHKSNKKASNKKLDSQISCFGRRIKGLITRSNENSLLKNKKSRLSLEKSYFLLDRGGCIDNIVGFITIVIFLIIIIILFLLSLSFNILFSCCYYYYYTPPDPIRNSFSLVRV